MADDAGDERSLIQAVDARILQLAGVVVDDVVLRAWGNEQVELSYLLLNAAISASGGAIEEADLWVVARAVAFSARIPAAVRH